MIRTCFCLLSLCFLCACAGNPPAWWNPSGTYGSQSAAPASVKPSLPSAVTPEEEEPVPMEQSIEPAMESYEEMNLSPISDADTREEPAPQAPAAEAAEPEKDAAPAAPEVKEELPADGSLPLPSVLE